MPWAGSGVINWHGASSGPYAIAYGDALSALNAQGKGVTDNSPNGTLTFTNGSAVVNWASAAAGHVDNTLITEDGYVFYVASFSVGVSITLDRVFPGTTGARNCHVFPTGLSAAVGSFNPERGVIGG